MDPKDVIDIYELLLKNNIQVWLTGGWGIDALLGKQTRSHKDLDVIMLLADVPALFDILKMQGYTPGRIWEENRWLEDENGNQIATAFVLRDSQGYELDVHAFCFDQYDNGIPAWEVTDDFIFTKDDLSGIGSIAGFSVQCITAQSQMVCHTGYELPERHLQDLRLLQEKFNLEYP
jgi:lincosamide nucleotidyltransferase A/C/D/E